MTFSEKLYQLRKEKKLSQEALAEKLGTTRQAVSKWENNQGYPEAEKLLALSDILEVSIDYLMKESADSRNSADSRDSADSKDAAEKNGKDTKGYFVSQEKAESWLDYEKASARNIGIGVLFLLMARIPFFIFSDSGQSAWVIGMLSAAVGIGFILLVGLNDRDYEYKDLKRNVLRFDPHYIEHLKKEYIFLKRKYTSMVVISFVVILLGATGIVFNEMPGDKVLFLIYQYVYTFLAAGSIGVLIYSFSAMSAYELLVENERRTSGILFRCMNKKRNMK